MIVNREYTEATVSANVESYAGGIAMNAEMFRMIISGIYKDKRLAAAREPLFNAFDSHIEAGKRDVPILIHSPTNLEPWFSVQDFGLGMDKEMVTKIFMIMGTSTKRENNKVVGAKGIGSKAPWAYTDMFTVTSVHNGTKTTYSAFLHKGLPRIAVLNQTETEEVNGVEIKFSVEPSDVDSFRTAIKKCLTYVTSPYEINDPYVRRMIEEDAPEAFHRREVDGWVVEFYRKRSGHENVVIMGQQPYISDALKDMPPCSVTIPIGACDVSPGREYTEEGDEDGGFGEKLKKVIQGVSDEIGKTITDELEKTQNIMEARAYFESQPASYFLSHYGYTWLRDKLYAITGNSQALSSTLYKKSEYRNGWVLDRDSKLTPLDFLQYPVLLFADKKTALKRRAVSLAEDHDLKKMFVVHVDDEGAKLAVDDYFKALFVYASSFNPPKTKAERAARTGNIRVCVFERDGDGYEQWVNKAALQEVEYYMVKNSKNQGDRTWVGEFRQARAYVRSQFDNLGVEGDEIWLVTPAAANHLPATAKKVEKQAWIDNTRKDFSKWFIRNNLSGVIREKRELRKLFGVRTLNFRPTDESYPNHFGHRHRAENFHDTSKESDFLQKLRERYEKKASALKDAAREKYPLMKIVGFRHWNTPDVKAYRLLIDKSKGDK